MTSQPPVVAAMNGLAALRGGVELQQAVLGEHASSVWRMPHLLSTVRCGGLILGVWEEGVPDTSPCDGLLVDLPAEADGYSARHTVVWMVHRARRGRGLGVRLRSSERRLLQQRDVDLVFWGVDPLDSMALYVSMNVLGALATGYLPDALGPLSDATSVTGTATDQLRMEWWLDAPRVSSRMDQGRRTPVPAVGLHEMEVLTNTTLLASGVRGLSCTSDVQSKQHALIEIPKSYADVMERDREAALYWRLRSREVLASVFADGYVGVGIIHQANRCFLHVKKGTRASELGEG